MKKITSEKQYQSALDKVYKLMAKGDDNVTEIEAKTIKEMSSLIQDYEKAYYPFPMPKILTELV